jgi:hypothetical protein
MISFIHIKFKLFKKERKKKNSQVLTNPESLRPRNNVKATTNTPERLVTKRRGG